VVKSLGWRIALVAAITVILGASWFGLKRYRSHIDCKQRGAAFERRVKSIEQDAHEKLRIGTQKDEVSRFFSEHDIPFEIIQSEAIGTMYTSGCAPFGCGADSALIGVRVKLDSAGAVAEEAKVVALYTDCL
jgi:hypothetical protein